MSIDPGATLGPYQIVERIGRGGMAVVYKAYHPLLDRNVAIKVLPEFFAEDPEQRERFKQEARAIALLKHPCILNVYDFGEERGIPYLVLELVEGGGLADQIGSPMDLHKVIAMLRPIADAIDHAHSTGVLHRDIKPSNILLRVDGTPVLADFGLARMIASPRKLTASGAVCGTLEYMSPEQAVGAALGPASDFYSFGVVAYEMLTGRVPFQGETASSVLLAHMNKVMPPMHEVEGAVGDHMEAVLRRALAKAPGERFSTASAFVTELTPAAWPTRRVSIATTSNSGIESLRPASRCSPRVLVVDDGSANRELIEACLTGVDCEIRQAEDGLAALSEIAASPPDLILLDVQMPGMDGFELCQRIKSDPKLRLVPIVMITALNRVDDRIRALEAGADDFMSKPVDRMELIARVKSALQLKSAYDRFESAEQVIFALVAAVEAKDLHREQHIRRVAEAARCMGKLLGLAVDEVEWLYRGGMIHDLGKVGVDEAILRKPGPLDASEMAKVREHPVIGVQIAKTQGSTSSILPIIRHHHEWFDGSGYPDGLCGEAIPLQARIVAICDGYDAMVNDRPYRGPRSVNEAIQILKDGAGQQWDPRLVPIFVEQLLLDKPSVAS